jgi:hypothetical protein
MKHNILGTEFYVCLQVEPTQLGPTELAPNTR